MKPAPQARSGDARGVPAVNPQAGGAGRQATTGADAATTARPAAGLRQKSGRTPATTDNRVGRSSGSRPTQPDGQARAAKSNNGAAGRDAGPTARTNDNNINPNGGSRPNRVPANTGSSKRRRNGTPADTAAFPNAGNGPPCTNGGNNNGNDRNLEETPGGIRPTPLRLNHGLFRSSFRPPNRTGSRSLPVPPSPGGDGLCGGLHRLATGCLSPLEIGSRRPFRRWGSPATVAYDNHDTLSSALYVTARLRNNFGYDRLTLAVATTPDGYKWRDTVSIRAFDGVQRASFSTESSAHARRSPARDATCSPFHR